MHQTINAHKIQCVPNERLSEWKRKGREIKVKKKLDKQLKLNAYFKEMNPVYVYARLIFIGFNRKSVRVYH